MEGITMTKTKTLTKLLLVGTAFAVSVPASADNAFAKNYLNAGDKSITLPRTNDAEGVFNSKDPERASWYAGKGQNKVYKTYRNYFYFYSPVRPRDVKKGLADYSGVYENWYTRKAGTPSKWDTRHLLVTSNKTSKLYNENFKTKAVPVERMKGLIKGGTYVTSPHIDKYGQFAGRSGEWRYMGYGADGTTVGNPSFPEDYSRGYNIMSYPYVVKPWNTSGWAKGFVPGSQYDSASKSDPLQKPLYNKKLRAITLLRQQYPLMQQRSVAWWMDRLSLMSDPLNDTAAFRGAWTPPGMNRYVEWTLINDNNPKNLIVEEMTVTRADTGAVVAKFNRNKPGVEKGVQSYYGDKKLYTGTAYNVEVKVKNLADTATTLDPSEIEVGYKENYNANIDYPSDFKGGSNGNEFNKKLTGTKIAKKASKTFTLTNVVIPATAKDTTLRFSSLIGAGHRLAQDNLETIDDIGVLPIQVVAKPGDVQMTSTQLIDINGKVVANPIPGEQYKVRYAYKYTGQDIKNPVYKKRTDKKGNVWYDFVRYQYPTVSMSVNSTINRTLPGKAGGQTAGDVQSETITVNSTVRSGQEFEFTTKNYQVYEVPKIKASGDFNITGAYSMYNSNGTNDVTTKEWNETYDYSVENLQVVPRTERTPVGGEMNVVVSFTVNQKLPTTAKDAGFEQAVDMKVNVDGKTHYITEHLKNGKNQRITFETTVDATIGQAIHADVHINDTAQAWEKDILTQANNKAKTSFVRGLVTSTSRYSNDLNANTAGFVTNAMLFPTDAQWETRTSNSWVQSYQIHKLTGEKVTYKTGASTNTFFKYRNEAVETKQVNQNESYKIEEVLFKSKYTKDNKLGVNADGWVNMATAQNLPRIKAGYGYELKVTVKYATNALTTQPAKVKIPKFSQRDSRTGNATLVRPYHTKPNIPNDLFVKTPDGKVLSVSGSRGSIKGLVPDATNGTNGRYTFTLKSENTLGLKAEGKIYVGEDVKDGEYGLKVWTPVINGIPTKNMQTVAGLTQYVPSQLADYKVVKFEVKGSATDDLVDTIIQ
jgi:hypothetical protein